MDRRPQLIKQDFEQIGRASCTVCVWRQNTVAQFITTRSILDLCEQATRRTGARVSRRWWEQTGIDLNGEQEEAEAAVVEPETEADSEAESED